MNKRSPGQVEVVIDRLLAMKQQESQRYQRSDYLRAATLREKSIDSWCRFKMVQWCYSVIDFARFSRETVSVSMSYLDRFLCSNSPRSQRVMHDRKEYQLAAMTCLYIAIKIFEPKMIETTLLSELSRGCYSPQDIKNMEIQILFDLKWHLNDPTPLSYLTNFLDLVTYENGAAFDRKALFDLARYQIELSVLDYKLMTKSSYDIAIAALTSSFSLIFSDRGITGSHSNILSQMGETVLSEFHSDDISKIALRLEDLHNREIPGIIQRQLNPASDSRDDRSHLSPKTHQRRRSLSPNCVST